MVVVDGEGETAAEGGGIGWLLLGRVRSSTVEKLLNVDFSRLEDGDKLWDHRVRSFHSKVQSRLLVYTLGYLLRRRRRRRHRQVVAVWVGSGRGRVSAAGMPPR